MLNKIKNLIIAYRCRLMENKLKNYEYSFFCSCKICKFLRLVKIK